MSDTGGRSAFRTENGIHTSMKQGAASEERSDTGRTVENETRPETEYETLFLEVSDRIEKWLRKLIWTGLAALVAAQALLSVPAVRHWIVKVDRLEGVPFERGTDLAR